MTIVESVKKYVSEYPGLKGGRLNVDFLPPDKATYSVDVIPAAPVVKSYLDGSSMRQFVFALASRAYYGPETRQQLDNLGFFEEFSSWIDKNNRLRVYPDLGEGRQPRKLEVTTSGYVFLPDTESACYQIQCKLTYFQKGGQPQ